MPPNSRFAVSRYRVSVIWPLETVGLMDGLLHSRDFWIPSPEGAFVRGAKFWTFEWVDVLLSVA